MVDFVSPKPTNWPQHEIDEMAGLLRDQLGFKTGSFLKSAVRRMGRVSYACEHPDVPDVVSLEIRDRDLMEFTIFLPDYTSVEDDNFLIAHELGHMALHFTGAPMRAELISQGEEAQLADREANQFAAQFLMPSKEFEAAWHKEDGDLMMLGMQFSVTQAAAETRAISLDLMKPAVRSDPDTTSSPYNDDDEDPSP